jgi:predicted nuclease of predicted toxin-antitoxin system
VKLLFDQHLSRTLVARLTDEFPGSSHVILHQLETSDDAKIWEFARVHGFALVTKDDDFRVRSFAQGHPPKVILIVSGNGPTSQVLEVLRRAVHIISAFEADSSRSLLELP